MALRTQLCLVMHRREALKTTNTGRVAARSLEGSSIVIHGERHWSPLPPPLAGRRALVLFPGEGVEPLGPQHREGAPVTLFVPDGTWRQASKMPRQLPWLGAMERVGLPEGGGPTRYQLRTEPRPGGLATAEAIARALGILEGAEVQEAIEHVFRLMVDRTLFSRGVLPAERVYGGVPAHVHRGDLRIFNAEHADAAQT